MSDGGDKDAFKKITPPFRSAQHLPCKGGKEVCEKITARCGHRALRIYSLIKPDRRVRCPHRTVEFLMTFYSLSPEGKISPPTSVQSVGTVSERAAKCSSIFSSENNSSKVRLKILHIFIMFLGFGKVSLVSYFAMAGQPSPSSSASCC